MTEIYLDSAATSLHKPPQVAQAVAEAICKVGNAARGAHGASLSALRTGLLFCGACGRIRKKKRGVERMNLISC